MFIYIYIYNIYIYIYIYIYIHLCVNLYLHRHAKFKENQDMDETYLCQRFFTVIFGMNGKFFVVLAFLNKLQTFLESSFSRSVYATELIKTSPINIFKATFLSLKIQFSIYTKLRILPWVEITWKCSKNCLLWLRLSMIQI